MSASSSPASAENWDASSSLSSVHVKKPSSYGHGGSMHGVVLHRGCSRWSWTSKKASLTSTWASLDSLQSPSLQQISEMKKMFREIGRLASGSTNEMGRHAS